MKRILGVIGLVIFLLLLPMVQGMFIQKENELQSINPYLFAFNSYIDLHYNLSVFDETLPMDHSVTLPITIEYWTDVPENFLEFFPWQIRNYILFGSIFAQMRTLHLEVLNQPEWASISFTSPEMAIPIPIGSDHIELSNVLVFEIFEEAPAESWTIQISTSVDAIKRVNGFEHQESVQFTVQYYPSIELFVENPVIHTPPEEHTFIPISITNLGNAPTRVTGEITSGLLDWSIFLIPDEVILSIGETEQITAIVIPPETFEGIQQLNLSFIASRYPTAEPIEIGPEIPLSLTLHHFIR